MSQSLFTRLAERYEDRQQRMSRREALAKLASASAAIALGGCVTTGPKGVRRTWRGVPPRVAVVGAGFSGLAAADALQAAGCDVVVLEARQRPGGRVRTIRTMSGKYGEAGGEWIGLNHPAWRRLAKRFDLDLVAPLLESGGQPIALNGHRLSEAEANELYVEMDFHLADLTELSRQIKNPMQPWTAAEAQSLDHRSVADWFASRELSPLCAAGLRAQLEHDNGAALESMSLLGLLAQVAGGGGPAYWTDSEILRCRGGNQMLAKALAKSLGAERLRFGTVVQHVELGAGLCSVRTNSGTVDADVVVLATPPSTWTNLSVSGPAGEAMPLPAVRMGVAHKYLATVTGPWWREAGMTADGISDGLLGYTWNAGEGQEEGEFELICGFGGGPQAERLPAADAERRVALRSAVEMMLPGFEKARVGAPAGEALLVWRDDPWTRAGYSCPALGDVTTVGPQLRAGLAVGGAAKLVFAGEHCCPAFVGYMEGALQSGMVAAEQVMAEGMDETVARRAPRMQRVAT